ncbi:MAG: Putative transmembrane protein, partial [uncultured Nocardioides sp.]
EHSPGEPVPPAAGVPPVAGRLRDVRRGAEGGRPPLRRGVPGRELPDRRHRAQAGRAHHRAADLWPCRHARRPVGPVAGRFRRPALRALRRGQHPGHADLHRPRRPALRRALGDRRLRRHAGPARLLLGQGRGRHALRGARRAQAPRAGAGDPRRPAGPAARPLRGL